MFLGISLAYWAVVCLAIAVLYAVKWPRATSGNRPWWMQIIMRWFHSVVWLFMAAAALFYWSGAALMGQWALRAAVIFYGIFFLATIYDRRLAGRGSS